MDLPHLLPLLSSLLYVLGVLLIRRTAQHGIGAWRTTFVSNLITIPVFALLWIGQEIPIHPHLFWQPVLISSLFVAAQLCTFLALERGDVSVVTPILGTKPVTVAWLTTLLLQESVPWKLWVGGTASVLALALLQGGGKGIGSQPARTIFLALGAALCFSLFDILLQKWAPLWGGALLLPWVFLSTGLLSLSFLPRFHAPLRAIPGSAWPWLLFGSLVIAAQALTLTSCIAIYENATTANIIFSLRGLWSVLAVWLVGHWFHLQREQSMPRPLLFARLAGAILMTAAVLLALS